MNYLRKSPMNKKFFIFAVLTAAVIIAGLLFFNDQKNTPENETARVCVKDVCYEVEIADDPMEQAKGLMFRESLAENGGMLFVFDREGKHSFWMKNTLIYLDILWIDGAGEIAGISENTPPCATDPCPGYVPEAPAKYALEIVAGEARKIGAHIGDRAIITFPE